jgi:transcriptional regulator with XRE-family HTH domain
MKDDRYKTIGNNIRKAREQAELSQKDLAEAAGFESATAISLIESGERKVAVEVLEKIAEVLHTDLATLLGVETQVKPDIKTALRADKDLSHKDKEQIIKFIDFVKQSKDGK